jgi:hypothetical protein
MHGLLVVATLVLAGCASASSNGPTGSPGSSSAGGLVAIPAQPAAAAAAGRTPGQASQHIAATAPSPGTVTRTTSSPPPASLVERPAANQASRYCPEGGRDVLCAAP